MRLDLRAAEGATGAAVAPIGAMPPAVTRITVGDTASMASAVAQTVASVWLSQLLLGVAAIAELADAARRRSLAA